MDFYKFDGKVKQCRHNTVDAFNNWSVIFYPNEHSLEAFRNLKDEKGLKNEIKKDEDGYFIWCRRPQQKMIKGSLVGFAPPEVVDAEGKPFGTDIIGDNSECTIKFELYSYFPPSSRTPNHAIRWNGLKVNKLVPYVPKDKANDNDGSTGTSSTKDKGW
jgi:hypothetical protein